MEILLCDGCFRMNLFEFAANPLVASTNAMTEPQGRDVLSDVLEVDGFEPLCEPPVESSIVVSPRSGYVSRRLEKRNHDTQAALSPMAELSEVQGPDTDEVEVLQSARNTLLHAEAEVISTAPLCRAETPSRLRGSSTPAGQRKSSKMHALRALDSFSGTPRACTPTRLGTPGASSSSGRPGTPSRPATPSWLDPPWPRQEVPFDSWTRPGTPSTVCDEADLAQTPKFKFVDGQCIPLRLGSSSKRLPPISSATSPGTRGGWQL